MLDEPPLLRCLALALILSLLWPGRVEADPGVVMTVTAYTDHDEGMRGDGITASGKRTCLGVCACGPRYQFGTRFYIEELGLMCICYDRGNLIKNRNLDLWFRDRGDALQFGVKHLEVEVLELALGWRPRRE